MMPTDVWLIGGPFHGRHHVSRYPCRWMMGGTVLGYNEHGERVLTDHYYDWPTGFYLGTEPPWIREDRWWRRRYGRTPIDALTGTENVVEA